MKNHAKFERLTEKVLDGLCELQAEAARANLPRDVVLTCALELVTRMLSFQCGPEKMSRLLEEINAHSADCHEVEPGWAAKKLDLI